MLNKDYYILLSLIETIERISSYISTYNSAEELYNNHRDFDATMMNFIVIGELTGKLTSTFKEKHTEIEWNKIYALRNIIAHHYFGINVDIVWQIIQNDLPLFEKQIKALNLQ